ELAAQAIGGASVGLFQDATASEMQYIVDHSDARVVVVEDQEQVDKLLEIRSSLPKLEHIIYWDPKGLRNYTHSFLLQFDEVEALAQDDGATFDALVTRGDARDL